MVTGMHRSGTSLLARVCQVVGVDLGDPEGLMQAAEDNKEGFFERLEVVELHEHLLHHLGGSWDLPPWTGDPAAIGDEWRHRAAKVIERIAPGAPVRGFKDPRAALFLGFWAPMTDRVVAVSRDPGEVASSLLRRDGMGEEQAHGLWLRYTIDLLLGAPEALLIDHRRLLSDPVGVGREVAQFLSLPEPRGEVLEELAETVRPELVTVTSSRSPGSGLGPEARRLHEAIIDGAIPDAMGLARLRDGISADAFRRRIERERSKWQDRLAPVEANRDHLEAERRRVEAERKALEGRVAELDTDRNSLIARVAELDAERHRVELERRAWEVRATDAERRLASLEVGSSLAVQRERSLRERLGDAAYLALLTEEDRR